MRLREKEGDLSNGMRASCAACMLSMIWWELDELMYRANGGPLGGIVRRHLETGPSAGPEPPMRFARCS
jgi:hypothetical protein